MLRDTLACVEGRIGLWKVHQNTKRQVRLGQPRFWVEPLTFKPNQIQHSWGEVAAHTIGRGLASYRVAAMYVEFENVASPGDPVTAPAFGRDEGVEYYDSLQSSGSRDYLRVPLLMDPAIGVDDVTPSYTNLTFFAQTQGVEGVHGKTFSDGSNSKVFGAALVAAPVFADPTQDIVFARAYFATAQQKLKEASSQIGLSWEITFK